MNIHTRSGARAEFVLVCLVASPALRLVDSLCVACRGHTVCCSRHATKREHAQTCIAASAMHAGMATLPRDQLSSEHTRHHVACRSCPPRNMTSPGLPTGRGNLVPFCIPCAFALSWPPLPGSCVGVCVRWLAEPEVKERVGVHLVQPRRSKCIIDIRY